jgi:hypothetical protein
LTMRTRGEFLPEGVFCSFSCCNQCALLKIQMLGIEKQFEQKECVIGACLQSLCNRLLSIS